MAKPLQIVSITPLTKADQTTPCELPQPKWWSPYGVLTDGRLIVAGGQELYDAASATIGKATPQLEVITIKDNFYV